MLEILNIVVSVIVIVLFIVTHFIDNSLLKELEKGNAELALEEVKIKLFDGGKMPERKTDGAVAFDCYARLEEDVVIPVGKRKLIPLGFACGLPDGYELQVRPRSGLTSKGIDNGWGTGDTDYTGEYMACLINNSETDYTVHNGDRICQIAIREVPKVKFELVEELEKTERGDGGFGHTGLR